MNIKNSISIALAVVLSIGCTSQHTGSVAVASPPPAPAVTAAPAPVSPAPVPVQETPKSTSFKVTVNGASLSFPDDSWEERNAPQGISIVQNEDASVRVMLAGNHFKGDLTTWDNLFTTNMKSKNIGGKVLSTTKVTVNGVETVFHKTVNSNKVTIFVWNFVANKNGFIIMCGSPDGKNAEEICNQVVNTLAIE